MKMQNRINFESSEHISKIYRRFEIDTQLFSKNVKGKYMGGVPIMYDANTRSLVIDSTDTHTIVFGSTGSLKSRAIVMPTIKVLGYANESMIINDSKGELHSRLAGELEEKGYNIIVINFRNPAYGNAWNPLYIPYKFFTEGNFDKAAEFSNDIANNLMIGEQTSNDPFWEYSASDLLFGLILLLFKYCKDHHKDIGFVNVGNILNLKRTLFDSKLHPDKNPLWKYASEDELISASLSGSMFAPNETKRSIFSVFDQKMRSFTIQPTLLDMLANNDFDIASVGSTKTAIFLITPDEKTSYHKLVSLFVKQSYEYLIYSTTLNEDYKVKNRVNYILDEFSSLPTINDMSTMISAARSRDIRFLLVAQSKNQLVKRYQEEAETIIANCSNWIFLTSRELSLLSDLSSLCGEQKNHIPNISIFELQHLSKDKSEALILSGRLKPALVNLLDIDKFGDKKYFIREIELSKRHKRKHTIFELSEKLRKKFEIKEQESTNFRSINKQTDDVEDLVKKIDERIAELEQEQREEQRLSEMKDRELKQIELDNPEQQGDK
jgi:type IV secretion system protein VirD4